MPGGATTTGANKMDERCQYCGSFDCVCPDVSNLVTIETELTDIAKDLIAYKNREIELIASKVKTIRLISDKRSVKSET